ncbi:9488_t:CDS:1, partial [Racocetra fulgida]
MYSAIKAITNSLMIIDDFVLQQVNYDDDESAFNDNNQTDDKSTIPYDCTNIEKRVKIALYNAINYYWQVLSEEGMLAALLDPRCKTLSFTSESL